MAENVKVPPLDEAPVTVVGPTPQSEFSFDFPFWSASDILVYVDETLLASNAYTVEGRYIQNGEPVEGGYGSGVVTLNTAVSNCSVTIDRLVVGARESQFSRAAPLGMPSLNADLNKLTGRQQDLRRLIGRALLAPIGADVPSAQDVIDAAQAISTRMQTDASNAEAAASRANLGAAYAVYMPGGVDVSSQLQAAFNAASDGDVIQLLPIVGADVFLNSTVTISKRITVLTQASFGVVGAIAGVAVTAVGAVWQGGRFFGNRTADQIGIRNSGSLNAVRDVSFELLGKGIHQPSGTGYMNSYERCRFRNNLTAHMHFEDGVGPRVLFCFGDTDGAWYSGSYVSPVNGAIWLQTEGAILVGNDCIHSGGLKIEASSARSIEWLLSVSNYWDSTNSGPGIHIINNQASRYIRGLFFSQEWSATGHKGIKVEGTGDIDGLYINAPAFHNNIFEAVDLQAGKNVFISDPAFLGNNATVPSGWGITKTVSASSVVVNTAGRVRIKGGQIDGQAARWNTTPEYQVYAGPNARDLIVDGTDIGSQVVVSKVYIDAAASGVRFINCPGLVCFNRGKATVANGTTSVTVTHGLSFTPQDKDIFVTPHTGWGSATKWWIDDVTSTNFKIVVDANPGLGFEFSWQAWGGDL